MQKRTVAIVGSDSLLGQDVRQVLTEQAPDIKVNLIGDQTESAIIAERGGEPVVISTLDEESVATAQAVFLAGSPGHCQRSVEIAEAASPRPVLIDLTRSLEDRAGAQIRAPLAEPPDAVISDTGIYVIAHPAAAILAEFYGRIEDAFTLRRSVAVVYEPASERGREGIEELQHQSVSLLSFKQIPQEVFDIQLCFNMLARYGSEARVRLESVEAVVARHLAELRGRRSGGSPMPSLRMIQAPVFHGHCFSVWAEFTSKADPKKLIKALASKRIEVRSADEEPATNSGVAGQSGMIVGRVEQDRQNPKAAWFWIVADNHRAAADNAVCLAQLLIPVEGRA